MGPCQPTPHRKMGSGAVGAVVVFFEAFGHDLAPPMAVQEANPYVHWEAVRCEVDERAPGTTGEPPCLQYW